MKVDLAKKESESGWFDLEGGGRLNLRLLDGDDLKAMRKACLTTKVEYPLLDGQYRRFESKQFNDDLWEEMQTDLSIIGWEGIFDRNETPIPVTKENKVLLMERVPAFRSAVDKGREALKVTDKAKAEAAEKNSLSGSGGETAKPNSL